VAEEPDRSRLDALEKRIAAAKSAETRATKDKAPGGPGFSQGEAAWRMVIELVTGMLLGLGIGYGLDVLFGTLPIFLVIFSLFGFAAGIRTMMGTAKQMAKLQAGATPVQGEGDDDGR
jgi:ATP synthase protein I